MLTEYTPQQSRFDRAFTVLASSCSILCQACGRTYFVTSPGHGDYENRELEDLQRSAAETPDRVIEVPDFGSVSFVRLDGKQMVIGCKCDPTNPYAEWIESHAEELTEYLRLYWADKRHQAQLETETADRALHALSHTDS